MTTDPWTSDDPQPSDFDAILATIDPRYVTHHEGNRDAKLRVLVSVEGDDIRRLQRIAEARSKTPQDVVSDLLRAADHPAAERETTPAPAGSPTSARATAAT